MRYSYKKLKLAWNRDDVILRICRGKRVLHVGAADSPYTETKFNNNQLLHKKLVDVSAELIGIDLDAEAANWLNNLGLPRIHVMDMNNIANLNYQPEIIVFGETIEHIVNVGACLSALESCMSHETRLVISTPNLFQLRSLSMILKNSEVLHSDHKIGFTYGLLSQLLRSQGLEIDDFYFTFLPRDHYPLWRRLQFYISKFRCGFAETLLAVCRSNPSNKR